MPRIFATSAALALSTLATSARAQDYSPHLETTGRGAFDLYMQAVWCGAVLEQTGGPTDEALAAGLSLTLGFARFMLDSGNVVDPEGTAWGPDRLEPDLALARTGWQAVLAATPEAAAPEALRCMRVFGQEE